MEPTLHADNQKRTSAGHVLNLYKRLGETPRERLERLRIEKPHYAHEVLSYAGRLDPMAEGVLLALVGSANKRREDYLGLDKEYVLDILFGFTTDTYDILGRVMESGDASAIGRSNVRRGLNEFRGRISQEYPPFSSKTVEGKPLFDWARQSLISSITLPARSVTIFDLKVENMYKVSEADLLGYIEQSVAKVNGDFRQEEVLDGWQRSLKSKGTRNFPCATVRVQCSSGTYVRSVAHGLGQELGIPALALHIVRTRVGEYEIEKSLR